VRTGERAGDDLGELAGVLVGGAALDGDEDVHAVAPARLREAGEPERVQDLFHEQRNL
jgi:hypothetical protein